MKCTNCNEQKMVKMSLIANQIWRVKIAEEIKRDKYDKNSEKRISAYLCQNCGHIDLWLEDNENE